MTEQDRIGKENKEKRRRVIEYAVVAMCDNLFYEYPHEDGRMLRRRAFEKFATKTINDILAQAGQKESSNG